MSKNKKYDIDDLVITVIFPVEIHSILFKKDTIVAIDERKIYSIGYIDDNEFVDITQDNKRFKNFNKSRSKYINDHLDEWYYSPKATRSLREAIKNVYYYEKELNINPNTEELTKKEIVRIFKSLNYNRYVDNNSIITDDEDEDEIELDDIKDPFLWVAAKTKNMLDKIRDNKVKEIYTDKIKELAKEYASAIIDNRDDILPVRQKYLGKLNDLESEINNQINNIDNQNNLLNELEDFNKYLDGSKKKVKN